MTEKVKIELSKEDMYISHTIQKEFMIKIAKLFSELFPESPEKVKNTERQFHIRSRSIYRRFF